MKELSRDERVQLTDRIRSVGALEFGDFTLKSGLRSGFYLDLCKLTLSRALKHVAYGFAEVTEGFEYVDAVGGPSVGADPIVGAILFGWGGRVTRAFLVRPAEKDHGKAGLVIGSVRPGDRCLVVEDVVTTGGSLLHAIEAVEAYGAKVTHAACILDRKGVLGPVLAARGIAFTALLTLDDLGLAEAEAPGRTEP